MTSGNFVCEAKAENGWRGVTLGEALGTYRLALKRCLDCQGTVNVHGGYGGRAPRAIHRKAHAGCPRMPIVYSGTPSPHPQALA